MPKILLLIDSKGASFGVVDVVCVLGALAVVCVLWLVDVTFVSDVLGVSEVPVSVLKSVRALSDM